MSSLITNLLQVQYDHGFKLGFALEQVSGIEIFNWGKMYSRIIRFTLFNHNNLVEYNCVYLQKRFTINIKSDVCFGVYWYLVDLYDCKKKSSRKCAIFSLLNQSWIFTINDYHMLVSPN